MRLRLWEAGSREGQRTPPEVRYVAVPLARMGSPPSASKSDCRVILTIAGLLAFLVLLGILALFGWMLYQSRSWRG
jgi:hypothetical protein